MESNGGVVSQHTETVYGISKCFECHRVTPRMQPVELALDGCVLSRFCSCKGDVGVKALQAPMPLENFNEILHILNLDTKVSNYETAQ